MANVSVLDVETGVVGTRFAVITQPTPVNAAGWTAGGSGSQAGTGKDHTNGKAHTHE